MSSRIDPAAIRELSPLSHLRDQHHGYQANQAARPEHHPASPRREQNGAPVKKISETSKCRGRLAPFCKGDGLDVGYGGDPIVPHAICMDLPQKYAAYESHVQHLHGDATNLHWFRDGALDWVYSSHVLEDFPDTSTVLNEWLESCASGGD